MSFCLAGVDVVHPNGLRALQAIDFNVAQGERVALIGPSGAGKSTLLSVLGTGITPTQGELTLLEQSLGSVPRSALRSLRARIGTVYQTPPIPGRQRVVSAVSAGRLGQWSMARALLSWVYPLDIEGVRSELARVDLSDKCFDRCDQLSGGQLQRVGIARTLYQQPDLILADEPVSSLDPALARSVVALLVSESKRLGATLVASLHSVELALASFDRVVALKNGQVHFDLPSSAVNPQSLHDLYA